MIFPRAFLGLTLAILPGLSAVSIAQELTFDFGGLGGGGLGGGSSPASVTAEFTPPDGERPAILFVTAAVREGLHLYAVDQGTLPDGDGPQATEFELDPGGVRQLGPFRPVEQPKSYVLPPDDIIWPGLEIRSHEGVVTWFAPIELPAGADVDSVTIGGKLRGLACNDDNCIPVNAQFSAQRGKGAPLSAEALAQLNSAEPPGLPLEPGAGEGAASLPPLPPAAEVADPTAAPGQPAVRSRQQPTVGPAYDLTQLRLSETQEEKSLAYYLTLAFFGGIVLNIMPCVLPVIGLKVMSFVQQAGESRGRALLLNGWYSLGIVAVFLLLAACAITLQLGWGDQFASSTFNIVLLVIVFAMALSLLGVWEIPIPGFVGSGTAVEAVEREGPTAAFLKGVLTTVLATPCTGPFMATALAWAVRQPAWTTLSVFAMLGLGMASPYLLIGAFPQLIRFLPKPGAWMDTFKKAMGFVLMATVVWLLTFIDPPLIVPTLAMMVGVAISCWLVSLSPSTTKLGDRVMNWTTALLVTAVTALGSYGLLYNRVMLPRFEKEVARFARQEIADRQLQIANDLAAIKDPAILSQYAEQLAQVDGPLGEGPWQPFSLEKLQHFAVRENRTVLVDFTADWCWTCKTLEAGVLKTDEVLSALQEANVVTMEADYTKRPEWLYNTIRALKANGVPIIAIFPAGKPYEPIVFRGAYTKGLLLDAIRSASDQPATQTASLTSLTSGS